MLLDVRWTALLLILCHSIHVRGRVIDDDDDGDFLGGLDQEDPYDEQPFEEDRYEEPMMGDQSPVPSHQEDDQKSYRTCSGPSDCGPDECCRIGMERYSEPTCLKLGAEGDFCRMGQEPENRTLYYPNGEAKEVTDSYILFCPCAEGLTCLRALCRPYKELYLMDRTHVNTL